jgi:hypothetical protein
LYASLTVAKDECKKDAACGKVYDAACDGVIFKLCKKDTKDIRSNEGSCLHMHNHSMSGNIEKYE